MHICALPLFSFTPSLLIQKARYMLEVIEKMALIALRFENFELWTDKFLSQSPN
jgi:hypothetical protein